MRGNLKLRNVKCGFHCMLILYIYNELIFEHKLLKFVLEYKCYKERGALTSTVRFFEYVTTH